MNYVCPFAIYCPQGHNKKIQPSMVCWHFYTGKCTEEHKIYENPELRSIGSFRGELDTASPPNDGIKTCLATLTDIEAQNEQWVSGFKEVGESA